MSENGNIKETADTQTEEDEMPVGSVKEKDEVSEGKHPHPYLVGAISTVAYAVGITLFLIVLSKVRLNIDLPTTAVGPPPNNVILIIIGAALVCLAMFAWFLAMAAVHAGGKKQEKGSVPRRVGSLLWMLALTVSAVAIAVWVLFSVVLNR
jgi:hypothetical protein